VGGGDKGGGGGGGGGGVKPVHKAEICKVKYSQKGGW